MRKHTNPYRINDPSDIFEVSENSSHPELEDCKRVWYFESYRFDTATALEKFFNSEGLNPRRYWMQTKWYRDGASKRIEIHIIPKHKSVNKSDVSEFRLKG